MLDLSRYATPSRRYGVGALLRNLLPLAGLYLLAPRLAAMGSAYPLVLLPFIGLFMYRLTLIMHDCGHGTLFASRQSNYWVGRLLGYVSGIDFLSFQKQHARHHRNYGEVDDPQGFQYLRLPTMGRAAFFWHGLKPLLGLNVRYVLLESALSPPNLRRMVVSGELLIFLTVQAGIALVITDVGRFPLLLLLPPLAAVTFGLFLSQLRGISEHGQSPAGASGFVRSHRAGWLGRLILFDLHFNYHREHHLYPGVPSCHLPELSRVLQAPVDPSIMQTLLTLWNRR